MRRAEDLCASAEKRWSARYTGFLSDREQDLCAAALNRVGCDWYRFDFYPGLAAITDHHQPDAPVCYYEIPQGADAQALALIGGWAE